MKTLLLVFILLCCMFCTACKKACLYSPSEYLSVEIQQIKGECVLNVSADYEQLASTRL